MKKAILISLMLLLTIGGQANAWYWPPASIEILPVSPSSADVLSITLSGEWPDSCIPNDSTISLGSNEIYLDAILNYPLDIVLPLYLAAINRRTMKFS